MNSVFPVVGFGLMHSFAIDAFRHEQAVDVMLSVRSTHTVGLGISSV